mgnify:CR=1 FL=1
MSTLLKDEELLKSFCDRVLPELKDDEVLLSVLIARKKYGAFSKSERVLDRVILKDSSPDYVLRKIRKLSFVESCYYDSKAEREVSSDVMVIYIDVQPKSFLRAFSILSREVGEWTYQAIVSEDFDRGVFKRLDSKLFSALARSTSRQPYYLLDIDSKDSKTLREVVDLLGEEVVWISETRGGYHVIVNRSKEMGSLIYSRLSTRKEIEISTKQGLTPAPGTLQGGFLVRRVELK